MVRLMSGNNRTSTYPDGIAGLLQQMERRRDPLTFADGEALPPLDVDLTALREIIVPEPQSDPYRQKAISSSNHRKLLALREELAGHSELAVLHGLLVAHLRKRAQPDHTAALFQRLWAEEAAHLMEQLNPRWQVSAITTFGDHGLTPVQRQIGLAMSTLFGAMKLYESERRYSGRHADQTFDLSKRTFRRLPMDMDGFAISNGGLDVNMLGRLWKDAEEDEVLKPLAHGLLDQLIHDPRTIFRRLRRMRSHLEELRTTPGTEASTAAGNDFIPVSNPAPVGDVPPRRSGILKWGVVCTTNAPLSEIKSWAAHYLDLGAHRLYLYLDAPDPDTERFFAGHGSVLVTQCDAAHWERIGKLRPDAHQRRQGLNATHCLHNTDVHMLGHFDIDEFLLSTVDVTRALEFVPADMAYARIHPVELLTPIEGDPVFFKRTNRQVGLAKFVLDEIYPNYGSYLAGGFVSHTSGKVFARTGIKGTQFGIHHLKYHGKYASNRTELPKMTLAHFHSRGFDHFAERVRFRMERGSYKKNPSQDELRLADLLNFLLRDEGEAGLRSFYEEVCTAQPSLLEALQDHGMLFTHDLELDAKTARVFGEYLASEAGAA